MRRAVEIFESMAKILHYVSGGLIVGLMLLTTANILGRWLWDLPLQGSVELTEIGMVAIVFLGFAYAEVRGDHIRVDILYERVRPRGKVRLGLFAALVSFVTVAAVVWRLYDYSNGLQATGRTTSALGIPLYYVGWIAVVGAALYALGIVAAAFRHAEGPDSTPADPPDERSTHVE